MKDIFFSEKKEVTTVEKIETTVVNKTQTNTDTTGNVKSNVLTPWN